ncbi:MAG: hypothetical protein V3575_02905 [Candidatus Absconditabacteria bacterium]
MKTKIETNKVNSTSGKKNRQVEKQVLEALTSDVSLEKLSKGQLKSILKQFYPTVDLTDLKIMIAQSFNHSQGKQLKEMEKAVLVNLIAGLNLARDINADINIVLPIIMNLIASGVNNSQKLSYFVTSLVNIADRKYDENFTSNKVFSMFELDSMEMGEIFKILEVNFPQIGDSEFLALYKYIDMIMNEKHYGVKKLYRTKKGTLINLYLSLDFGVKLGVCPLRVIAMYKELMISGVDSLERLDGFLDKMKIIFDK